MKREGGSEEAKEEAPTVDPRMEGIIEKLFLRCCNDGCYEQAIGVALDTRRIDKLEQVCMKAIEADKESILGYTFNLCQGARNISSRDFRLSVIDVLVKLYGTLPDPDYTNVCFALQYLDRPLEVAQTLYRLCRGSDESALQAYQIAFDLQEAENQGFVLKIVESLKKLEKKRSGDGEEAEEEEEAVVRVAESIRTRRVSETGEAEYRVRWKGCTWEEDTWESRATLEADGGSALAKFEAQEEAKAAQAKAAEAKPAKPSRLVKGSRLVKW